MFVNGASGRLARSIRSGTRCWIANRIVWTGGVVTSEIAVAKVEGSLHCGRTQARLIGRIVALNARSLRATAYGCWRIAGLRHPNAFGCVACAQRRVARALRCRTSIAGADTSIRAVPGAGRRGNRPLKAIFASLTVGAPRGGKVVARGALGLGSCGLVANLTRAGAISWDQAAT